MLYDFIYSLKIIELKIFKTYIEINLANNFIKFFKSSIKALIFLLKKPDNSFELYINYYYFYNLIIINWYLLFLISKTWN